GGALFSVSNDGTVGYDESGGLAGLLSGAGSDTLTVNGRSVTIDATALAHDLPNLSLNYQGVTYHSDTSFTITVLPGTQYLHNNSSGGGAVLFKVANDGTVDYSNPLALSDTLEGRGTRTLTLKGETIHIDARALSGVSSTFTIVGVGTFDTSTVQTLTLLPG